MRAFYLQPTLFVSQKIDFEQFVFVFPSNAIHRRENGVTYVVESAEKQNETETRFEKVGETAKEWFEFNGDEVEGNQIFGVGSV
jgi:hypothetical protein